MSGEPTPPLPRVGRVIRSRPLAAVLLAVYLVAVAWIVFLPTDAVATRSVDAITTFLQSVGVPRWVTPTAVEVTTNVLLFVPAGFLGRTFRPHWRWWHWLAAGLVGSLFVEASQYVFLSQRTAQLMDVLANTLGAVLGYAISAATERTSPGRATR